MIPNRCDGKLFIAVLRGSLAVLLTIACTQVLAQAPDRFVRVLDDANGRPAALQVAIARYIHPDGANVDLVGAIHVADRAYFRRLDRRLAGYETVLYELVAEPDSAAGPRGGPPSLVGLMQGGMKEALGLAFQLDEIDYSRANMVHADLTPDQFTASMRERGETFVGMLFRAWALGLAQQSSDEAVQANADLLKVVFADNRQLALKRLLAAQLADQTELLDKLSGDDGSTLIEIRNARALEVLRQQLAAGRKRIAIFYGAGHLADLAARLEREFGMRRTGTEWIEAWDLRKPE